MRALDIAIAGCGPGGLAAALLLARDGHRVRLFERFAEARPIGSGLMIQPTGQAVLRELGLLDSLVARSARIDRLFGLAGDRPVLDVRYAALGPAAYGLGTHRTALFDVLFDAVRAAGISVETGRTIAGSETSGAGRCLRFEDGARTDPFDLIVDASGAGSVLAPPAGHKLAYGALWATLDWPDDGRFAGNALEQRYRRASVMAGVLPLGSAMPGNPPQTAFFWSLRADQLNNWRARGFEAWKDEVAALWPATDVLLDQLHSTEQLTFARYAYRTLPRPIDRALVHIGDAWHSTSPQLGQGANMALLDAHALNLALRGARGVAAALAEFMRLRGEHVGLYQAMSALFTPVYQSDSRVLPFLRDRLVGPIARRRPATTILANMVSGLMADPLAVLHLRP